MRLRGCTKTGLPSVARPTLLRHIAPQASSRKWPDLPKPLPMGEVALRSNDGEGKPFTIKPLHSDKQTFCQRDTIVALPILCQHPCPLRRSAPMPGCGSQRLLRCRLHPAGRGPNSDSLFPPLAAVVVVAPTEGRLWHSVKLSLFARGSPTRGAVERSETERLY